jgi:hypothetical protein
MASGDVLKALKTLPYEWYGATEIAKLCNLSRSVVSRQLHKEYSFYNTVERKVECERHRKGCHSWRVKK